MTPSYEASMAQSASPTNDARTFSVVSDQSSSAVSPAPTMSHQNRFPDIYEMPADPNRGTGNSRTAAGGMAQLGTLQVRNI